MRTDGASVTIIGRAAGDPAVTTTAKGDRVTFRVLSTERRFDDAKGEWIDGDEYGVGVVCWRQVATGVLQHVRRGDPLVVIGRISTRKFERNGAVEYFTDVRGDFVGFDVSKAGGRIKRMPQDSRPIADDAPGIGSTRDPLDEVSADDFEDAAREGSATDELAPAF